jgi:protein phosphatase slingshot
MTLLRNLLKLYGEESQSTDPMVTVSRALVIFRLSQVDGECAMIEASPRLCIGSAGAAYNKAGLQAKAVTHILCLCPTLRLNYPETFTYRRVSLMDNDHDPRQLARLMPACLEFIEEALASSPSSIVLVHCFQGKSRSAAVCISYMMHKLGLSYAQALEHLRKTRPVAEPNPSFSLYLQRLSENPSKCPLESICESL